MSGPKPPHVVVVGAGFAGLWACRRLAREAVRVTLVDQNNYHTFFPLLYQVAAAELGPTSIAHPIRALIRTSENVRFKLGGLEALDLSGGSVRVGGEDLAFDSLLLATGSKPHFFGVEGAERWAFRLREMTDALPLRHQILSRFEIAAALPPGDPRTRALTFVIVGGGATGVEFAGALAELIYGPLLEDYPEVEADNVRVTLVEAGERLLPAMHAESSAYAATRLQDRRVELRLGTTVSRITETGAELGDDTTIHADTVVWTAGVQGDPSVRDAGLTLGPGGRVRVTSGLEAEGCRGVFVAGDLAYVERDGQPLPQVAQVAIQQGEAAAENILRQLRGQSPIPFVYRDPGLLAVIGRYAAVAEIGGYRGKGLTAWGVWALVHVANLIGFRNRLLVLVNWAWNYLSFRRATRLILPERDRRAAGP